MGIDATTPSSFPWFNIWLLILTLAPTAISEFLGVTEKPADSITQLLTRDYDKKNYGGWNIPVALLLLCGIAIASLYSMHTQWKRTQQTVQPSEAIANLRRDLAVAEKERDGLREQTDSQEAEIRRLHDLLNRPTPTPRVTVNVPTQQSNTRCTVTQDEHDRIKKQLDDTRDKHHLLTQEKTLLQERLLQLTTAIGSAKAECDETLNTITNRIIFPVLHDKSKVPTALLITPDTIQHISSNTKDRFIARKDEMVIKSKKLEYNGGSHEFKFDPRLQQSHDLLRYWKDDPNGWELIKKRHQMLYE